MNMQKNNPPLIFLHGALGTSKDMDGLMEYFKEQGHETYSLDFSGHGPMGGDPSEFRIDRFAHDLDGFIKKMDLKNPIAIGYSMGGYVALYHKANFKDSPLKMIFTYGTKFNWTKEAVSRELPMLNPDHLLEKFPAYVETLKSKHGEKWKHLLLSTAHMMQHLENLDGLTKEDLTEIDIPVTLILGDQDRMVTTEETHLTASAIPHAQVKTISHSKHELERTNLREVARMILDSID